MLRTESENRIPPMKRISLKVTYIKRYIKRYYNCKMLNSFLYIYFLVQRHYYSIQHYFIFVLVFYRFTSHQYTLINLIHNVMHSIFLFLLYLQLIIVILMSFTHSSAINIENGVWTMPKFKIYYGGKNLETRQMVLLFTRIEESQDSLNFSFACVILD